MVLHYLKWQLWDGLSCSVTSVAFIFLEEGKVSAAETLNFFSPELEQCMVEFYAETTLPFTLDTPALSLVSFSQRCMMTSQP